MLILYKLTSKRDFLRWTRTGVDASIVKRHQPKPKMAAELRTQTGNDPTRLHTRCFGTKPRMQIKASEKTSMTTREEEQGSQELNQQEHRITTVCLSLCLSVCLSLSLSLSVSLFLSPNLTDVCINSSLVPKFEEHVVQRKNERPNHGNCGTWIS